jgi:hypothetical protein
MIGNLKAFTPSLNTSDIIKQKRNLLHSLTIDEQKANTSPKIDLGYNYSNGHRLKYIENRSTLSISQIYNDNGGLVTTAYVGDTSIDSDLPTS